MLIRIANVAQSAAGKDYANDIAGRVFFPRTKEIEIKAGMYAYAVETTQTKTKDEDGNLIDLTEPRKILQITATFANKQEAIDAAAEAQVLEAQVVAEVVKQAKGLNLTDEAITKLANAW